MPGATRTTCAYCGVGCGVLATPDGAGAALIEGDPDHPANFGRLCSKGSALGETLSLDDRLLSPRIGGRDASWDEALSLVASRFAKAVADHGPDSVAFYVSGQLLTEDYYVANKLMKGFIGSANIDTNSRLCMASSVAGHRRAFGTDTVPGTYEDLEAADLIVLVGSNLAWCHPVLFQRVAAAKATRPDLRIVNIDPRRTATSEIADLHLPIRPGADVALFNRLLAEIAERGAVDHAFVDDHLTGFDAALAAAQRADLAETGLSAVELAEFFRLWIETENVVTVYSQGVNQSSAGADKVNTILNCHLATGRIGRPGMGPFSVTGQPNAMGGREVGGLANALACHMEIANPDHRAATQAFWDAPTICRSEGLKAVDLFRACADGKIKALWIMSTNPAVSMPEADAVREAIRACPFVVVSDIIAGTDTNAVADVLLPATGWGEKSGTVTNSERRISRQRAFLPALGDARPDWRIICDVAQRMGFGAGFDFDGPAAIFREHAALSGVASGFGLDFDISCLAGISDEAYDALSPTQWPVAAAQTGGRFYTDGRFHTPDGRGRMIAVEQKPLATATSTAYPFRLNTGRVRDHWHTMTRTAKTSRLSQHIAEPFLEIHPEDAALYDIGAADLVEVSSPHGRMIARTLVSDRAQRGSVFAPMHWTSRWASLGRANAPVASDVDPVSGQPELKGAAVAIARYDPAWHGFAVSTRKARPAAAYWATARTESGWRAELADADAPADWEEYAHALFDAPDAQAVTVEDAAAGAARIALLEDGRPIGVLYAAPRPVEVARAHVIASLADGAAVASLLAGRPGGDTPDPGATVCSCFNIGVNTILRAIESEGLVSVEAIGAALGAGSNCGSCRPELGALLAKTPPRLSFEVAAE